MVYFIQAGETGPIKIGKADKPMKRIAELQTGNPHPLRLVGAIDGGVNEEQALHQRFTRLRLHGEWFEPSAELLEYIRKYAGGYINDKPYDPSLGVVTLREEEPTQNTSVAVVDRKAVVGRQACYDILFTLWLAAAAEAFVFVAYPFINIYINFTCMAWMAVTAITAKNLLYHYRPAEERAILEEERCWQFDVFDFVFSMMDRGWKVIARRS